MIFDDVLFFLDGAFGGVLFGGGESFAGCGSIEIGIFHVSISGVGGGFHEVLVIGGFGGFV